MKEIFVYTVGTKLKKHDKRNAIIFTDRIHSGNTWILGSFEGTYSGGCGRRRLTTPNVNC